MVGSTATSKIPTLNKKTHLPQTYHWTTPRPKKSPSSPPSLEHALLELPPRVQLGLIAPF